MEVNVAVECERVDVRAFGWSRVPGNVDST